MEIRPERRKLPLLNGSVADVLMKGEGPPLIFLHPAQGRVWSEFLDRLALRHTVYAPLLPGCDEPDELLSFDGFRDLALYYDDLFRTLRIERAIVVGHGFGGMAAAEFSAQHPDRVSKLILIASLGLWNDEAPIGDIYTTHPSKLGALLFSEPGGAIAKSVLIPPTKEDWLEVQLALGAAAHFTWPIPDRDLRRRLYRISAPTLLIWGTSDRIVPPSYADDFAAGLHNARKVLIHGAAHFPYLEKPDEVLHAIQEFVGASKLDLASA